MGVGNGVVIRFLADTGSAVRDIAKLEKATGKSMTAMGKATTVWKKTVGPALAGAAAALGAAAVAVAVEGVKAAADNQTSQAKLARAMKNTTKATDAQVAAMEEYVDLAQRKTGLDDGDIRTGLGVLIRYTKNGTRAQALSNVAQKIALERNLDYLTVVKALAKAEDGQTTALKRLGIPVGENAQNYADLAKANKEYAKAQDAANLALEEYGPKSEQYRKALGKVQEKAEKIAQIKGGGVKWLAELNDQFKGAIADDAKSYAGAVRRVATAWGELGEAFGTGVLDQVGDGNEALGTLDDTLYDLQPTAENIGKIVGGIAESLADAATYIGPVVDGFARLNSLGDGILTNGSLVTFLKAMNGDIDVPGTTVTRNPNQPSRTPEQLAQEWADNPRNPAYWQQFYARGGYNPSGTAQRTRDAVKGADTRSAAKAQRTRQPP